MSDTTKRCEVCGVASTVTRSHVRHNRFVQHRHLCDQHAASEVQEFSFTDTPAGALVICRLAWLQCRYDANDCVAALVSAKHSLYTLATGYTEYSLLYNAINCHEQDVDIFACYESTLRLLGGEVAYVYIMNDEAKGKYKAYLVVKSASGDNSVACKPTHAVCYAIANSKDVYVYLD